MASTTQNSFRQIDVLQFGEPHAGAAYLLSGRSTALIETGTARSAPVLVEVLRGLRLDWIFLTHVHLDHAGGAGILAALHPEAQVVVHPAGRRHLIDPTRLVNGVRAASPALFPEYGLPLAVPEERVRGCADGERFDLGSGLLLEAIYTPGHAPHHVCYFENSQRRLFAGDAVGHYGVAVDLPLTVPPRFDRAAALASLDRLLRLQACEIAFTHFGVATDAGDRVREYARRLEDWLEEVSERSVSETRDEIVERILALPRYAALSPIGRHLVAMCVDGALASLKSEESP
jgi:glyoxylase-like metal-dependent hydrolase (beta-lactamase superfamily II)